MIVLEYTNGNHDIQAQQMFPPLSPPRNTNPTATNQSVSETVAEIIRICELCISSSRQRKQGSSMANEARVHVTINIQYPITVRSVSPIVHPLPTFTHPCSTRAAPPRAARSARANCPCTSGSCRISEGRFFVFCTMCHATSKCSLNENVSGRRLVFRTTHNAQRYRTSLLPMPALRMHTRGLRGPPSMIIL